MAEITDNAFRTYAMESPHTVRTLRKRLMQQKNAIIEGMVGGYAVDYADYRHRTGKLVGINFALDVCDEMEKEERQ